MPPISAPINSQFRGYVRVAGACSSSQRPGGYSYSIYPHVNPPQAYNYVYASILEDFHAFGMVCGVNQCINADGIDKQCFHLRSVESALFGIREDVYRNCRVLRGYSCATHVIRHALNNFSQPNGAW